MVFDIKNHANVVRRVWRVKKVTSALHILRTTPILKHSITVERLVNERPFVKLFLLAIQQFTFVLIEIFVMDDLRIDKLHSKPIDSSLIESTLGNRQTIYFSIRVVT